MELIFTWKSAEDHVRVSAYLCSAVGAVRSGGGRSGIPEMHTFSTIAKIDGEY